MLDKRNDQNLNVKIMLKYELQFGNLEIPKMLSKF